jgi:hypothetical protein
MQTPKVKCLKCGNLRLFALKADWVGDIYYCLQCGTLNMATASLHTPKYYQYFEELTSLVDKPNINKSCIDAVSAFTK